MGFFQDTYNWLTGNNSTPSGSEWGGGGSFGGGGASGSWDAPSPKVKPKPTPTPTPPANSERNTTPRAKPKAPVTPAKTAKTQTPPPKEEQRPSQALLNDFDKTFAPAVAPVKPAVVPPPTQEAPTQAFLSDFDKTFAKPAVVPAAPAPAVAPKDETKPPEENQGPDIVVASPKRFFTISNFRAEIDKNDILPTHSYLVTFAPFRMGSEANVPLTEFIQYNSDKLILRCESAVLPTVQVLEEENIRRYGYGLVEKVPYGVQFNDLTLTWLVDRRSELIDFFHQWMNTITFYETEGATAFTNSSSQRQADKARPGLSGYRGYEVGYKDEYSCPLVRIRVYDRQLNNVTEYILYDVFPMNIQSQNLAWNQENEAQKLSVTFAFTNMTVLAPQALNGKLEAALEAQAAADAKAAAAEKENKKKQKKDYSRPRQVNPQSSVGASSPDATNNSKPKSTNATDTTGTTTTKNLSGTKIGPPAP